MRTINELIRSQAARNPDALAVLAPERQPLNYTQLLRQMDEVGETLATFGLANTDRIAILVPGNPEMAVALLGICSAAVSIPLNPSYRAQEIDQCFTDLKPGALVIQSGIDSSARAIAHARNIPVIELVPDPQGAAGTFKLTGAARYAKRQSVSSRPDDVTLLLQTSGTTARPKTVPLTHSNICASAETIQATLELSSSDRCLNIMPLFHIHGIVGALVVSITAGASVVCSPGFIAPKFFDWLDEFQPTWYTAVPSMHQSIVKYAKGHRAIIAARPLRLVRSSSDALPTRVQTELEAIFSAPVIQAYGMTEAAHQITSNPVRSGQRKPGSVGIATGTQVAVMGEMGSLLPGGQTGEIVIRGENVMAGYLENPTANALSFSEGWLRTGDLGYLDEDNYLFLTGRIKELINQGGEKISPREVDQVLLSHPAVAQAAAYGSPDPILGERVSAAIVLREGAYATEHELKEFTAQFLADFKVPKHIVFVSDIPKGASGKPQRVGLATKIETPLPSVLTTPDKHTAPEGETELGLAKIWQEVLRLDRVGSRDNFFDLRGDSILAAMVISRVREAMQVELSVVSLFDEAGTIHGMARLVEQLRSDGTRMGLGRISHASRENSLPLSSAQERLAFLAQFPGGNLAYHRAWAARARGPLKPEALEQSLNEIVRRHEVLRTAFRRDDGIPVQVIEQYQPLKITQIDLRGFSTQERERDAEARRIIVQEARHEFDLARAPLLRFACLQLAEKEHVLLLITHHIIFDAWSEQVFFDELACGYDTFCANQTPQLPGLAIQFSDYAAWQRKMLGSELLRGQLNYWKNQLAHLATLELPTDRRRPPDQTFTGARYSFTLPRALLNAIKDLCRRESGTLFMGLLAVFQTLLYRYSAQDEIVVGMPIAGRNRAEVEDLIGTFVNTLVFRTNFSGDPTFIELLARVKEIALGAYANQDLPFERIVQELQPERDLGRNPLYQVVFQLKNLPQTRRTMHDLNIEKFLFDPLKTHYDLSLDTTEEADGLFCSFEYSTDLFNAETIQRMAGHFQVLLEGICASAEQRTSDIPLLTPAERQQLLMDWNDTKINYQPDKCIHQLFEEQVDRTPDSIALVFDDQQLTYRELNSRTNQLAHYLQGLGVGPDTLVGICMEHSLELITGIIAIFKAGGAYVPLDPAYPSERLAFMLEDTQAKILITQRTLLKALPENKTRTICLDTDWSELAEADPSNPTSPVTPQNLAYVIYTSGSTGKPKGVQIEHRNVTRLFRATESWYHFADDTWTLFHSYAFDFSVWEIWGALLYGGRLVIVPFWISRSPETFYELLQTQHVTVLNQTPTAFQQLMTVDESKHSGAELALRLVIFGGEALDLPSLRPWFERRPENNPQLINMYGITETTVHVTYRPISKKDLGSGSMIGKPIPDLQVYILDRHQQPVPIGVAGEMYVGGAGLARGYLNRPDLTAEKFIRNPFDNEANSRLYKTGDLARYLPDGDIEYLGRIDNQVKIRGYRIELNEIESALREHPSIREAVVCMREDIPHDKRMAAYYVPRLNEQIHAGELYQFLRAKLPGYMIPSAFVELETLPLTVNGKMDRSALPAPISERREIERFQAPQDRYELAMVQIWESLLGVQPIGVSDNFFELGGHSLLAARLFAELEKIYGRKYPLRTLFEAPTIEQLAVLLQKEGWEPNWSPAVPIRKHGTNPPLFYIPPLNAILSVTNLAYRLGPEQPVYGLISSPLGDHNPFTSMEDEAAFYVGQIRSIQREGPYYLAGWSYGGLVAYEVAQQLVAHGERVAFLGIMDTGFHLHDLRAKIGYYQRRLNYLLGLGTRAQTARLLNLVRRAPRVADRSPATAVSLSDEIMIGEVEGNDWKGDRRRLALYTPRVYPGSLDLFRTRDESPHRARDPLRDWGRLARGGVRVHDIPGDHTNILLEPNVQTLAEKFRSRLEESRERACAEVATE